MKKSDETKQVNKKVTEVKAFPVPFALEEIKEHLSIATNKPTKEEIINQAIKFHSLGKILEAAKYYKYFISQGFKDQRVFSNYGAILRGLGKLQEAEFSYSKAIELNPNFEEAHYNLGNIFKDLGNLKEAELSYRRAIDIKPNFAKAHYNLGIILKDLGNLKEAELSYRRAIDIKPNYANAHSNLGNILKDLGNLKEAELSYRRAIDIKPNYANAHSNLGTILRELGNLKEAEITLRKAIEIKPNYAEPHYNLGIILNDLGKFKEAELNTRKAIEIKPNYAEAHSNLGTILNNLGNFQEAEITLRKAIEIKPGYAEAHFNLALVELLKGKYQSGLENYEFRFKTKKPHKTHGQTKIQLIDYKKLNKEEKILIISEQGLGDTIQYMRYIPYLRRKGFNVSFCAQTKLHSLIKESGIDQHPLTPEQSILLSEGRWIPLLSIPRYLKVTPKNPIIAEPYISSTNELNQKWKNILSTEQRPIIGINWQGNQSAEKNNLKGRSFPLETFSNVIRENNFKFLSLQKGYGSEQVDHCSFKNRFVQCQSQVNLCWDFLENAAIINNCDLIITCDTAIAHLAGGMGKTTWLLLKYIPEWRWGIEGESTFWYPSMRLFRQKELNNWNEVMLRISTELHKIMKGRK